MPIEKAEDFFNHAALDKAIAAYQKRKATGKTKRKVREADIEAYGGDCVKDLGGIPYKFTSPGRAAVPDRLNLLPIPPEHRELVARYVRFAEYKRPGEKPTGPQQREHERLRALGFYVAVIDSKAAADTEFPNLFK